MENTRTRWIIFTVCLLGFALIGLGLWHGRQDAPPPIVVTVPSVSASAPIPTSAASVAPPIMAAAPAIAPATDAKPALMVVSVTGEVKHPALYRLPGGSRVWNAIQAAGGPTSLADEAAVNLAAEVQDGQQIYVPIDAMTVIASHPTPAFMSKMLAGTSPSSNTVDGSLPRRTSKHTSTPAGSVDINTASLEQLQTLPGIGPAMAARIASYRQQVGSFRTVDDLRNVSGIGPKKFAKIAPLVTIN